MSKKLQYKFLGSFAITDMIVPKTTFWLELPEYWKIHPVFHVSKLKKHIEPNEIFKSREELQSLPEIVGDDQHEEYEVK